MRIWNIYKKKVKRKDNRHWSNLRMFCSVIFFKYFFIINLYKYIFWAIVWTLCIYFCMLSYDNYLLFWIKLVSNFIFCFIRKQIVYLFSLNFILFSYYLSHHLTHYTYILLLVFLFNCAIRHRQYLVYIFFINKIKKYSSNEL